MAATIQLINWYGSNAETKAENLSGQVQAAQAKANVSQKMRTEAAKTGIVNSGE